MSNEVDAIAASELATAAMLAALFERLAFKGLLSDEEVREVYERALLMIEEGQGSSPEAELIFAAARELIEQHLRPGRSAGDGVMLRHCVANGTFTFRDH